ncbi:MAG: hypothetical protein GY708_13495, partial [Actinomycetia bacterium]|nr:hypothetical protein [Actinomycetes bacterium]
MRVPIAPLLITLVVAASCGGTSPSDDSGEETTSTSTTAGNTTAAPATTESPTATTSSPDTDVDDEVALVPTTDTRISVVGAEEMVFDWTTDRCEDEHIPDIAARAIRNAEGLVQLYVTHYVAYRMIGTDLNAVTTDCSIQTMASAFDPDPSQFNEAGWIAAPYTEDGETVYAVVHNEYRGFVFDASSLCPRGDHLSCIDVTLTMSVSTDGGATFDHIATPPAHLAASLPYVYDPEGVPSGLWQTSNIVKRDDGFHYLMTNISAYPESEGEHPRQWSCLLRTDDLSDPTSWRYWNGNGFDGHFSNPYTDPVDTTAVCPPVARPQIGAELVETIVFDEALDRYVAMGMTDDPNNGGAWGVYYSLSEDLITWSNRRLLIELPMSPSVAEPDNDLQYAYPALIDPDSESANFDTSDGAAYVYITRFNAGGSSLDRDLLRYPIAVETVDLEAPEWTFDTEGDVEGWNAINQLDPFTATDGVLSMASTGTDPYMESSPVRFPGPSFPAMT